MDGCVQKLTAIKNIKIKKLNPKKGKMFNFFSPNGLDVLDYSAFLVLMAWLRLNDPFTK